MRAYSVGVVSGDSGHFLSAELRYELGQAWQSTWQAVAFIDSAQIAINKNSWVAGTSGNSSSNNTTTLSGAGFGLNLMWRDQWTARLYIATPIRTTPALAGATDSVRAWAEVRKAF